MTDPRHAIRALTATDRRGAVWCASLCALYVAHLWTDPRPRRAVVLAGAWAVGVPVPAERLRAYDDAAGVAADVAAGVGRARPATSAAAYAACAAANAAAVVDDTAGAAANAATYAAYAAAIAAAATVAAWVKRRDRHLSALAVLVVHQTTPLVDVPLVGRPGALVAWDAAAADIGPVRVGTLGDALARARRHRLRWYVPVERAVAERLDDGHPAWALVGQR